MAQKWNLQDIRPAGPRKTMQEHEPLVTPRQDISVRRPKPQVSQPVINEVIEDSDVSAIDIIDGKSERKKRMLISSIIVIVIFAAGIFVNSLTSGAEITVYPKFKDATVQATFTAYKEPQAGELSYELLSLEASGEKQVEASGEQQVSEQATGKLFIYNAYSTSQQRLIKNTRFESPEGLIFRIKESVEVPGATKDAQGALVPGVITADVFADGPGDQYNIKPSRFTIPGLKENKEQYEKVYAESTETMAGGFEGKKFMIDEAKYKTAEQALQLELRNALLERLKSERPAGFVVYDGAVTFTYEVKPATESGNGNMATIKQTARLHVPMFSAQEFASYIARHTVSGFEQATVEMPDPLTLTFSYPTDATRIDDLSKESSVEFDLKGTSRVIWSFDADKLKSDLAGKSKTAIGTIIGDKDGQTSGYPALTRIEVDVKPFWKKSFPEDPKDITITTIVGEKPE